MEIIASAIEAVGNVIGHCVVGWTLVNIIEIIAKTILIMEGNIEPEKLKDWTEIRIWKDKKDKL